VSFFALAATLGMNWIALAPFPMQTTFSPAKSQLVSQRAEWNDLPSKSARPGRSGTKGRFSCPVPLTSTSATISSPLLVRTRH
jgi:hypothetical protein